MNRALLDALLDGSGFATYATLIAAAGIERGHGEDRALRAMISDLKRELRPHGVGIVDMYGLGYAIPAADMAAARALRKGKRK